MYFLGILILIFKFARDRECLNEFQEICNVEIVKNTTKILTKDVCNKMIL